MNCPYPISWNCPYRAKKVATQKDSNMNSNLSCSTTILPSSNMCFLPLTHSTLLQPVKQLTGYSTFSILTNYCEIVYRKKTRMPSYLILNLLKQQIGYKSRKEPPQRVTPEFSHQF